MKKHFLYIILLLALPLSAKTLPESETHLSSLFEALKTMPEKEECMNIHKQIETELIAALQNDSSFNYPFASLLFLGKIYSDDNLLRIYSWNVPFADGTFFYGCIIQQKDKIHLLKIKETACKPPINKQISQDNWYGALYFRAIPTVYKKKTYYTLLGWAGNDDLTNVKLIDALSFDEMGKMQFGMPVFDMGKTTQHRVLFEYGDQYTMSLDYDKRKRQIIFDRLAPSSPKYEGLYTYYGPSFIYDAFQLKRKEWQFKEDVDARNEE
ncbi:MAG: hypothetical protein LBN27_00115 [Prevotellaceae bacterium]|jgi:hypothetical protein|nr:hypothetical protein [Prevotellaceae bacterium]